MQDVLFVAILVVFFGLAVGFVKACERIVGPDVDATRAGPVDTAAGDEATAA